MLVGLPRRDPTMHPVYPSPILCRFEACRRVTSIVSGRRAWMHVVLQSWLPDMGHPTGVRSSSRSSSSTLEVPVTTHERQRLIRELEKLPGPNDPWLPPRLNNVVFNIPEAREILSEILPERTVKLETRFKAY
jgi:hypothetical protein